MIKNAALYKLRESLKEEKLDGILVSNIYNILHLTGFSGFSGEEREAYLVVSQNEQYLITDSRYSHAVKKSVPDFELVEISPALSHFEAVKKIVQKHNFSILGIEENDLTGFEIRKILPFFKNLKHYSPTVLRSVKTEAEVGKIEKACELGDRAFDFVLKKIKSGVSEKEVAWELEKYIKENGGELSFPSIVAFGENSAVPHHQTGNKKLLKKDGQFVLLDFGVKVDNYCSDMTRTVFFGKPSEKQKKMYEAVLNAQKEAVSYLKSAPRPADAKIVDAKAREYIEKKGFEPYSHGLGHGIGLQVHEAPSISSKSSHPLKPGMVFSIEPGIYMPDYGSPRSTRLASTQARVEAGGVRIEDIFVLEEKGIRQLTHSPSKLISF